jgi:hypothetical protein
MEEYHHLPKFKIGGAVLCVDIRAFRLQKFLKDFLGSVSPVEKS